MSVEITRAWCSADNILGSEQQFEAKGVVIATDVCLLIWLLRFCAVVPIISTVIFLVEMCSPLQDH